MVIKKAPTKKPNPLTVFLDPVSQLTFLKSFPLIFSLLRNFTAVLLPILVKSLAIPQRP